jgi:hypothetical protein
MLVLDDLMSGCRPKKALGLPNCTYKSRKPVPLETTFRDCIWVGGGAWFGSMMPAVATYNQKKVQSTFIIKNNQPFFPMQPLHAVLKLWESLAGPLSSVFQTTIPADVVKVFALAYTWSQRGESYFLLTIVKQHHMR